MWSVGARKEGAVEEKHCEGKDKPVSAADYKKEKSRMIQDNVRVQKDADRATKKTTTEKDEQLTPSEDEGENGTDKGGGFRNLEGIRIGRKPWW